MNNLFITAAATCDWDAMQTMSNPVFFRSMAQGIFRFGVSGWYQSESEVISEDCLGAWMDPMI